jgi:membrane protease YdiL (CAAX protease family)
VVRRPEVLLLLIGVPLVVAIVAIADRKGSFRIDAFPTALRKHVALALLGIVLCATVLLPALAAGEVDTRSLSFVQVFSGQALLALFLLSWWLLAGRPSLAEFLALKSARPASEAGAGVCLGLIGWTLTIAVSIVFAYLIKLFGAAGPEGVPPLVRWIAALSPWKRLLIVLSAMTVEEFHFRAFLQRRVGAVAASLLFLLSHGGYGEPYFLLGLVAITTVLAAAFHKTGSTIAPMLAHGTFDAVQLFVFLPLVLKLVP